MVFGRRKAQEVPEEDPTGWMLVGSIAEFLLMHTKEIKYMAMFGYTFLHGCKLYPTLPSNSATSFRLISLLLRCTGGGILVPVFINSIPVLLAHDAYPLCIFMSFILHEYAPILRDVMQESSLSKGAFIVLYEVFRSSVVTKLTKAAAGAIAPSAFEFAVFGPIFCGTVAGCGGVFLPLDKGLGPILQSGLAQPMLSAFLGATFYHLFLHTSISEGMINAPAKGHLLVTIYFILDHWNYAFATKMRKWLFGPNKTVRIAEDATNGASTRSRKKRN